MPKGIRVPLEEKLAKMRERVDRRRNPPPRKYIRPVTVEPPPVITPELREKSHEARREIRRSVAKLIRSILLRKHQDMPCRLEVMVEKLAEVAQNTKHPRQIEAFEALMSRGWGKVAPSDEELEARAEGGFQVIFIERPVLPEIERPQLGEPKPDFIEGEVVSDE